MIHCGHCKGYHASVMLVFRCSLEEYEAQREAEEASFEYAREVEWFGYEF